MKEHWDIMKPAPHLALSIVGGAKNFKMDGRKREAFKTGLVSAARYMQFLKAFWVVRAPVRSPTAVSQNRLCPTI